MSASEFEPLGTLGVRSPVPETYSPDVLFVLPRERRDLEGLDGVHGLDVWNAHELSWLNLRGLPQVAQAQFQFQASSHSLVESKSLKLYLNSLNMERFESAEAVRLRIQSDLSAAVSDAVAVRIGPIDRTPAALNLAGLCLDGLDVQIDGYVYDRNLLSVAPQAGKVHERLYSHVLRTLCPVTGQPDWGSVWIEYTGQGLDHAALLRYLVSYRTHTGFHEQCAEQIFSDLWSVYGPDRLTVCAWFLRRGGLDINCLRSTDPVNSGFPWGRAPRQ